MLTPVVCFTLFWFAVFFCFNLHSLCWSVLSACDYSCLSICTMIRSPKLPEPAVVQARSCMRPMLPPKPDMWQLPSRRRTRRLLSQPAPKMYAHHTSLLSFSLCLSVCACVCVSTSLSLCFSCAFHFGVDILC